jgi:hypothetical protein
MANNGYSSNNNIIKNNAYLYIQIGPKLNSVIGATYFIHISIYFCILHLGFELIQADSVIQIGPKLNSVTETTYLYYINTIKNPLSRF